MINSIDKYKKDTERQRLRSKARPWLEMIRRRMEEREKSGSITIIRHVQAHTGEAGLISTGNRIVDNLANQYREGKRKSEIGGVDPLMGEEWMCVIDNRKNRLITNDIRREARKRFEDINKRRWIQSKSQSLLVKRNRVRVFKRDRELRERRRQQGEDHPQQQQFESWQEQMDTRRVEVVTDACRYTMKRKIDARCVHFMTKMITNTTQYVKIQDRDTQSDKQTKRKTMRLCCHLCSDRPILDTEHLVTCRNRNTSREKLTRMMMQQLRSEDQEEEEKEEEERQQKQKDNQEKRRKHSKKKREEPIGGP
jgi:hypothetical protein